MKTVKFKQEKQEGTLRMTGKNNVFFLNIRFVFGLVN